jgi:hypothetical protein
MTAGTAPIYVATPRAPRVAITAANVKNDGTGTIGTDIFLLFTAGANGAYVGRVRFVISGSTASTASTATVGRVYMSTQTSGATTNANTMRVDEVGIPSITTDQTTVPTAFFEVQVNSFLAANETLLVSCHHAPAANTAVQAHALGTGDY